MENLNNLQPFHDPFYDPYLLQELDWQKSLSLPEICLDTFESLDLDPNLDFNQPFNNEKNEKIGLPKESSLSVNIDSYPVLVPDLISNPDLNSTQFFNITDQKIDQKKTGNLKKRKVEQLSKPKNKRPKDTWTEERYRILINAIINNCYSVKNIPWKKVISSINQLQDFPLTTQQCSNVFGRLCKKFDMESIIVNKQEVSIKKFSRKLILMVGDKEILPFGCTEDDIDVKIWKPKISKN